ncbi:MAG: carboxymuconolactone decarboxylase family protein [Rhodospirillales bacterium]|nr:carboxymuconolactone decarboxylase family protein [Rhodospirillales bacterium]
MPFHPGLPPAATLLDLFRAYPDTARPLLDFHEVLLRGPSPFTEAERELIAAYVSGLNGCRYCHGVHTATAERLGIAPGAITQAVADLAAAPVPERMRPVLGYAGKLTRAAAGVTEADARAILAAGWAPDALYHTVAVTALFNFMNRLVEGMGIALDPAYVQPAAKRLAESGYAALIAMLPRAAANGAVVGPSP